VYRFIFNEMAHMSKANPMFFSVPSHMVMPLDLVLSVDKIRPRETFVSCHDFVPA
jgi:hypothetical protein